MSARRWVSNALLVAGLAAVDIWIWSHALPVVLESWDDHRFDRQVQESQEEQEASPSQPERITPPAISDGTLLGRLSIPRLRLHAIMREGDGESTLSLALGHIPSTALPGQDGNVGVAGHRDTIFRSLKSIRKDDLIVIETLNGKYAYRVEGTEIVKPEKVSVLDAGRTRELTLVTCYPFHYIGSAPNRFIVRARQVTTQADSTRSHRRKARRA